MTFDDIRELIETEQVEQLATALDDLTPQERKQHAAELTKYDRKRRADGNQWKYMASTAIAAAALLPNASTLAPWLVRNQIWPRWQDPVDEVGLVLDVLRNRNVEWLPDLGARLAARLPTRPQRDDLFRMVVELCGDTPPDADGFLVHLASDGPGKFRESYVSLIPKMLDVVGIGSWLREHDWPKFLCANAPRHTLLDVCLARLQQGGNTVDMDGFSKLHNEIAPTEEEVAEHIRDYVAMLPGSRGPVATLAQRQLMRTNLDFDLLCDASRWVFARTEKKLVRTQLTWLAKHVKDRPDDVLLTTAELFGHEATDLSGRAVALVRKHLARTRPDTQHEIRALAAQLPADLATQLGGATSDEPVATPAPYVPEAMPDPIGTPDELAREILALFTGQGYLLDPITVERVLEAIVRLAWQDRDALREGLRPVVDKHEYLFGQSHRNSARPTPFIEFCEIIRAAIAPPQRQSLLDMFKQWRAEQAEPPACPERMLYARLHEIATGLERSPRPALVSTPTQTSGLLDPLVLKARLDRAAEEGWKPWPDDLWQALRRLPHDVDPALGRELGWAGPPEVVVSIVERSRTYGGDGPYAGPRVTERRLFATVTPGLPNPERFWGGAPAWNTMIECWPMMRPTERDVMAAHLVPEMLANTTTAGDANLGLLPMLARCDGPVGPGMRLALTYGLGAQSPVLRAHATDALLILTARDQLDGAALGDTAGKVLARGDVVLGRVVPALRDVARSGAAPQMWDLVAVALPVLLTHRKVVDLLELAVELAHQVRPKQEIAGLAEIAARKGSSRTVKEAKRLVTALV